ncbi:MAG: hypothetical protein PVH00_08260 [Gemmatimonadota bacterium]|jgi:hypothetical protein
MLSARDWKTRTFAAGRKRSELLKDVDAKLAAYALAPRAGNLAALCTAVETWSASKQQPGKTSGYAALLAGTRNRTGAVQELVTDLRQLAGKPAFWPDKNKGSTYTVTLDQKTRDLLRDMRTEATSRSVAMIAAMDVDWTSFAFDQIGAMSSLAIDLGHTDYGSGWEHAQNNKTSLGQFESTAAGKILNVCLKKSGDILDADERVENVLKGAGIGVNVVLGVLKYHLFQDGVMSKAVPFFGPLKESVDAVARGSVDLRLAGKSSQRVTAARSLLMPTSDAATAIDAFQTLLQIETAKTVTDMAYRLLKDTALIVTNVLTSGAMTVVQVVTAIVEVVVAFVYQLVYCLVFQSSVKKCREWVTGRAMPEDLDFRGWTASCPLLGAYFIVGLAAGGGATTALSMFGQPGVELSSTDFQAASTKLLKVRQAAAAYVNKSPVDVKWTGPNGEKYKWIDSLVKSEAKSASVGPATMKIHHWSLSDDASRKERFKHRFHENGNRVWSLAKTAWSVV